MNDAEIKIRMIKASLRCFVFGLLALLPVIGIPFGIAALILTGRVRAGQKRFWNPARPYWVCGNFCAFLGTIFWTLAIVLVIGRLADLI
jgi:hypothetical protein